MGDMTSPRVTPTRPASRTAAVAGAALAAVASLAAACGDDSEDSGPTAPDAPVEVTAIDYAYVDLPAEVAAGTEFRLVNDSDVEVHEFVAVRLADDEDRAVSELVQLPPDQFGALLAGVETVIIAPPSAEGMVVEGTGVLDEPGRYAIVCVIPTGADPDEYLAAAAAAEGGPPEVDGGPPHTAEGMFAEIVVTG